MPIESGRQHARVIENDEIAGAEEVGKIPELAVCEATACGGEMEEARGGAIGQRLLGD